MEIYLVGGFVRDTLLAREGFHVKPSDRDYVVVGSSPEEMVSLGFIPVGADFPVFLHPETHEEYALARTERKTAPGYRGFAFSASPDVTLEEDLKRRDLTVNAIAMRKDGALADPWGGEADIRNRLFRHVSDAFREDPVRILRLARFSARLPEFSVHPDTMELLKDMVNAGEADALVPERVFKEVSRGLMEKVPSRMLSLLSDCGAWEHIFPDLPYSTELASAADRCEAEQAPLSVRLAVLFSFAGKKAGKAARSMRSGADAVSLAELVSDVFPVMPEADTADAVTRILERSDVFRRPERFAELLAARRILTRENTSRWKTAAEAARAVIARDIIRTAPSPKDIPAVLHSARSAAVQKALFTDSDLS